MSENPSKDIDNLFERLRTVEDKQLEDSINLKNINKNLEEFLTVFKGHDEKEMDKYSQIQEVIRQNKEATTKLESKVDRTIEIQEQAIKRVEKLETAKQEFSKKVYQGSGAIIVLSVIGGLVMYGLNLYLKVQTATGG